MESSDKHQDVSVAIIEDDALFRSLLEARLRADGFTVWSATSAEDFYRSLLSMQADVVVCDIGLPGEDGLSLAAYLRSHGHWGIVAVTARHEVEDRVAALEAGFDHFFSKPVAFEELEAAIVALSRKRRSGPTRTTEESREEKPWVLHSATLLLEAPNGKFSHLTSNEYQLTLTLLKNAPATVPKARLVVNEPGQAVESYHKIENTLLRLRKKVLRDADTRVPIHSVFGKGLAFTAPGRVQ